MEITSKLPLFGTCPQDIMQELGDIQLMKEPDGNLNSKSSFLFKNQSYVNKDALFAVKLDPAVLEAQVTVGATEAVENEVKQVTSSQISQEHPQHPHEDTASSTQMSDKFKAMLSMQRAALESLSSQQFDLLLRYVDTLRKQRLSVQKQMECAFCKNNGHPMTWYSTHSLKDSKGRVRCPILRSFYCRRCGATGDHAHTIKYCPENLW